MNKSPNKLTAVSGTAGPCPRCRSVEVSELQRLQPEKENPIWRCRACGHLFSPRQSASP
jgi:ribosomal protein L37AE/L43A